MANPGSQGVKIALVMVVLVATALLAVFWWRRYKRDLKFREDLLNGGSRMGDAEFLEKLPVRLEGRGADLALAFRAVFAGIGKLPGNCVSPDMPLADLFRAQAGFFSDGLDVAEIVMELEDQLDMEIPEQSLGIHYDDTVGTCTAKILQYALNSGRMPRV